MSARTLKRTMLDPGSLEKEIQRRMRRGKTRLLISNIAAFIAAMIVVFFVI